MIQLGKQQNLKVLRFSSVGAYIGEERDPLSVFAGTSQANASSLTDITEVLLPNNELGEKKPAVSDTVRAFVYLDSEDRPVATLKQPMITVGAIARLTVREVNRVGAFLDWGLPKDLLLPYKEQTRKVSTGENVLVSLYVDKSHRLCATMNIYKLLRTDSEYRVSDQVIGTVYQLIDNFGAYVAVDDIFSGMIPKRELVSAVKPGDIMKLRVTKVQPDGKLELSMREPGYRQLFIDADLIMNELKKTADGFLPYHDKSSSDELKSRFNMSKNSFKRACGHLLKEGRIEILDNGIRIK
ncbi:MAG: RNA-binding protein [Lachnospiraceae bacterium]|nr:RNA-binding protein [Lachnospiraceae bacterium]